MAKKNRPGSVKGDLANFYIQHSHGYKSGLRSRVSGEEFARAVAAGMLIPVSHKCAQVKRGFVAILDKETGELGFTKAHGHVVLNWDLIKRLAIYSERFIGESNKPEPEYETFERVESIPGNPFGQTVIRQRLLYYSMPLL